MEYLHAVLCDEFNLGPWAARAALFSEEHWGILHVKHYAKACWDYRVIEMLKSSESGVYTIGQLVMEEHIWLPGNAIGLPWEPRGDLDVYTLTHAKKFSDLNVNFDKVHAYLTDVDNHNIQIMLNKIDVPASFDLRQFTTDELSTLSAHLHINNVFQYIDPPKVPLPLLPFNAVEQVQTMIARNIVPIMPQTSALWETIGLPDAQWSDASEDPCELKGAWPHWMQNRCHAICSSRDPCLRHAERAKIFCKFHGSAQPRQHIRESFKRRMSDVSPDEYKSPTADVPRYPETARPENPMSFAKGDQHTPQGFYLPVVRYEGLYFGPAKGFCGKFFFYEPNSRIYLYLGNTRMYGTKVQAFVNLVEENASGTTRSPDAVLSDDTVDPTRMKTLNYNKYPGMMELWRIIEGSPNLEQYYNAGCFKPADRTEFMDRFMEARYFSVFLSRGDLPTVVPIMPVLFPTDNPLEIDVETGEFDPFDQPICKTGARLGIDTIIFQHEIGGHDAVTEIMDTRKDWKKHLYEIPNVIIQRRTPSPHSKIWFPRDDGIVYVGSNPTQADMRYALEGVFGNVVRPLAFMDFGCKSVTDLETQARERIALATEELKRAEQREAEEKALRLEEDLLHLRYNPDNFPSVPKVFHWYRVRDLEHVVGSEECDERSLAQPNAGCRVECREPKLMFKDIMENKPSYMNRESMTVLYWAWFPNSADDDMEFYTRTGQSPNQLWDYFKALYPVLTGCRRWKPPVTRDVPPRDIARDDWRDVIEKMKCICMVGPDYEIPSQLSAVLITQAQERKFRGTTPWKDFANDVSNMTLTPGKVVFNYVFVFIPPKPWTIQVPPSMQPITNWVIGSSKNIIVEFNMQ